MIALFAPIRSAATALVFFVSLTGFALAQSNADNDGGTGTGVYEDEKIIGNVDAPVTMVEYASMTCSHCGSFHNGAYKDIKKNYIDTGKVRLLLRDLPWDGMAFQAALVARCVPDDQYEKFISFIFKDISLWSQSQDDFFAAISLAGVSRDEAEACIQNEANQKAILDRRTVALDTLKVSGTPYFFINGTRMNGARQFDEFAEVIDEALKAAGN